MKYQTTFFLIKKKRHILHKERLFWEEWTKYHTRKGLANYHMSNVIHLTNDNLIT